MLQHANYVYAESVISDGGMVNRTFNHFRNDPRKVNRGVVDQVYCPHWLAEGGLGPPQALHCGIENFKSICF